MTAPSRTCGGEGEAPPALPVEGATQAPVIDKRWQFCGAVAYFCGGYYCLQWINAQRLTWWTFFLPGERAIPFVPIAVFGYSLSYLGMAFLYVLETDAAHFRRTVRLVVRLTTVHLFCFLLFPVRMVRPDVTGTDWIARIVRFYYQIDLPTNVFPSLHVAYPFLATLCLWNFRRRWAYGYLAATLIVMVSVVLVKQHYIVDTIAGLCVAAYVYRAK